MDNKILISWTLFQFINSQFRLDGLHGGIMTIIIVTMVVVIIVQTDTRWQKGFGGNLFQTASFLNAIKIDV